MSNISPALRRRVSAFLAAVAFLAPFVASAANFGLEEAVGGIGQNKPGTFDRGTGLAPLIGRIIAVALSLVGTVFLALMIYAGFLWMTARGESKAVDKAKSLIKSAVIGLIIVASAYALTTFVLSALSPA